MTETGAAKSAMIEREQLDGIIAAAGIATARDIMEAFWRSTDQLMQAMRQALDISDLDEAYKTAHALKGSAANVGAEAISASARLMEISCRDKDEVGARQELENLKNLFEQTKMAFSEYFENA